MLRMHRPAATGIATTFMVRAVSPRVVPSTLTSVLLISDYKTSRLHPIVRLVAPVEPLRIQAVRAMRVKVARCGLRQTVVGTQSLLIRIGPREAKGGAGQQTGQGGVGGLGAGGAVQITNASITLTDVTFDSNQAIGGTSGLAGNRHPDPNATGGAAYGGAIRIYGDGTQLFSGTDNKPIVFKQNFANGGFGALSSDGGDGNAERFTRTPATVR